MRSDAGSGYLKTPGSYPVTNRSCIAQVPVLYDKHKKCIVSNESADIIRMLATEFGAFHGAGAPQLYPAQHAEVCSNSLPGCFMVRGLQHPAGPSSGRSFSDATHCERMRSILDAMHISFNQGKQQSRSPT